MSDRQVPVLIAGGSLVGLSTSLLLAAQDVPHLLVERHRGTRGTPGRLVPPADHGDIPRGWAAGGDRVRVGAGVPAERRHRLGGEPGQPGDEVLLPALQRGRRDAEPHVAAVHHPDRAGAAAAPVGLGARRRARLRHRAGLLRAGRRRGDGGPPPRDGGASRPSAPTTWSPPTARTAWSGSAAAPRWPGAAFADCVTIYFRADMRELIQTATAWSTSTTRSCSGSSVLHHRRLRLPRGVLHHQPGRHEEHRRRRDHGYGLGDRAGPQGARPCGHPGRDRQRAALVGRGGARCASATGGCSWPGTPRTSCRPPGASAATPASATRTTWPGSWPRWSAGPRALACWTPTTPSAVRCATLSSSRPTRAMCCGSTPRCPGEPRRPHGRRVDRARPGVPVGRAGSEGGDDGAALEDPRTPTGRWRAGPAPAGGDRRRAWFGARRPRPPLRTAGRTGRPEVAGRRRRPASCSAAR